MFRVLVGGVLIILLGLSQVEASCWSTLKSLVTKRHEQKSDQLAVQIQKQAEGDASFKARHQVYDLLLRDAKYLELTTNEKRTLKTLKKLYDPSLMKDLGFSLLWSLGPFFFRNKLLPSSEKMVRDLRKIRIKVFESFAGLHWLNRRGLSNPEIIPKLQSALFFKNGLENKYTKNYLNFYKRLRWIAPLLLAFCINITNFRYLTPAKYPFMVEAAESMRDNGQPVDIVTLLIAHNSWIKDQDIVVGVSKNFITDGVQLLAATGEKDFLSFENQMAISGIEDNFLGIGANSVKLVSLEVPEDLSKLESDNPKALKVLFLHGLRGRGDSDIYIERQSLKENFSKIPLGFLQEGNLMIVSCFGGACLKTTPEEEQLWITLANLGWTGHEPQRVSSTTHLTQTSVNFGKLSDEDFKKVEKIYNDGERLSKITDHLDVKLLIAALDGLGITHLYGVKSWIKANQMRERRSLYKVAGMDAPVLRIYDGSQRAVVSEERVDLAAMRSINDTLKEIEAFINERFHVWADDHLESDPDKMEILRLLNQGLDDPEPSRSDSNP